MAQRFSFFAVITIVLSVLGIDNANGDIAATAPIKRNIPEKVLIGYASRNYDNVRKAVIEDGVNIVIWAFMEIVSGEDGDDDGEVMHQHINQHRPSMATERLLSETEIEMVQHEDPVARPAMAHVKTGLDLEKISTLIDELNERGYSHVLHLVSFGGWDGPHLDPLLTAEDWYYSGWKNSIASSIFHGIDWDFEGNDNLQSGNNEFTVDCLNTMGEISRFMKEDGYVVTMAPPLSYLNLLSTIPGTPNTNNHKFSRLVNLTILDRPWHNDFHYFGMNVYAYLLAKYDDYIDLISIQLYESYSDGAMAIHNNGIAASDYLYSFVLGIAIQKHYYVDFTQDPSLNMEGQFVNVPLSKLVVGLANGWALSGGGDVNKTLYISPAECREAYVLLEDSTPRGFMFWTIEERGTNDVYLARDIGKFLLEE